MAWTHAQLAKKFGVSPATIGYWKSQGCPVKGSIEQIAAWREEFNARDPRKQGPTADAQIAQLKRFLLIAETKKAQEAGKLAELKRLRMEGELVPIEEAKKLIAALTSQARTRALNLVKTHAAKFVGLKSQVAAERALDELIRQVVAAMSSAAEGK